MIAIKVTSPPAFGDFAAKPAPTTSSDSTDLLSAFLAPCRIRCQHAQPWRLRAPWGLQYENPGLGFLVVRDGTCLLLASGMTQDLPLGRHDFVVFTRNSDFVLRDHKSSHLMVVDNDPKVDGIAAKESTHIGGNGAETRLMWGRLGNDDDYTRQAFSLLPPLLVAQGERGDAVLGLEPLLRLLFDEIENRRPGSELLVDRIVHALFVVTLRATPPILPQAKGLISALGVPGLGIALAAIHARPENDWSVAELADLAGLSRSKFAVRFVEVLGCPPFDYLRDVRMRLACQLLLDTDCGIKEISTRVGYATEASFGRAFSQCYGMAPGAYRRQKRASRLDEGGTGLH